VRVSFLKPPIGGILGLEMITFVEPLGLECVAGGLELEGHTCQIVDFRIDDLEEGIRKVRAFDPAIVGLQCNFTTERYRAMRLARRLKAEFPKTMLVMGGHDASRDPGWFVRPGIDVIVVGDGEEVMPGLVNAHEKGQDLKQIPGLVLNRASGPVATGPAPARRDIDDLPLPARHLIRDYAGEYYINFRRPLALLETARGCPYRCNFCSVWQFHETTFREKSPKRVVQELQQIEAPNVFITDDIFWMNHHRGRELAEEIQKSGIKKHYTLQTRSDIIVRFPELVELWKDCGPMSIFLGLEKIDDEGLKAVNKRNTAAKNEQALQILKDLGVGYTPNFIVDPDWDHEDFAKLRTWIEMTGAYNSGFSVLTPLPGTELWESVKDRINTEDWELFDITHTVMPTKLPLDEFYAEYAGLWKHALDVRFKIRGRMRTQLDLLAALAMRKVSMSALRKGMRIGTVLGRPDTFLRAHDESPTRLLEAAFLEAPIAG